MAKLGVQNTAGFNAGQSFYAKPMRVADIVIDPEIAIIFSISQDVLDNIKQNIQKYGFRKEEPVVVWKGCNILVDGHTRYTAMKELGFDEIPGVEREFASREEAILYTLQRQTLRRNLTSSEKLRAVQMIAERIGESVYGEAQVMQVAEQLNIGKTTIYEAQTILRDGDKETIEAVEKGGMSIKQAYAKTVENKPKRARKQEAEPQQALPDNEQVNPATANNSSNAKQDFIKEAVTMLIKAGHQQAAELLVEHFLEEGERELIAESTGLMLVDSTGRK